MVKIEERTQNCFLYDRFGNVPHQCVQVIRQKLHPDVPFLWQKAKSGKIHFTDDTWYEPRIVGHDPLDRFMTYLSTTAHLREKYTNHPIRATVITTLDNNGIEARHIIKLSSHKNESTVKEYACECPDIKRKEMYNCLSEAITPKSKKCKFAFAPTNTNSDNSAQKPTETKQKCDKQTPDFDLGNLDFEEFDTIDDQTLANLIYDMEIKQREPKDKENRDELSLAKASNAQQINVTTYNQGQIPHLHHMYFPNSTVNIHYHMGK